MQNHSTRKWNRVTLEVLLLVKSSPLPLRQVDIFKALQDRGLVGPMDGPTVDRALHKLVRAREIAESNAGCVPCYQSVLHAQMDGSFHVFD